jgi:hypothetical protein
MAALIVSAAFLGLSEAPKATITTSAAHAQVSKSSMGTGGDVWAFIGDCIVFVALLLSFVIFRVEQRTSENLQIDSTLSVLNGVRHGMDQWGKNHFGGGWAGPRAYDRANEDRQKVMGTHPRVTGFDVPQNFRVPKESLVALVEHSETLALLDVETLKIANEALRRRDLQSRQRVVNSSWSLRLRQSWAVHTQSCRY